MKKGINQNDHPKSVQEQTNLGQMCTTGVGAQDPEWSAGKPGREFGQEENMSFYKWPETC